MTDIATLQLKVDSRQAETAADDLDDLARSAKGADAAVDGVANASKKAKAPLKAMGNTVAVTTKKMGLARQRMQQVGFQVQDMAVQIQGGTSAFVAFGQQGSQLAGAFGPGGAILGAFIALGSIAGGFLYNALMKASKAMDSLDKDIEALAESMGKLTESQKGFLTLQSEARSFELTKTITALNKEAESAAESLVKLNRLGTFRKTIRGDRGVSPGSLKKIANEQLKITAAIDTANAKLKEELELRGRIATGVDKQSKSQEDAIRRRFSRVESSFDSPAEVAKKQHTARLIVIDEFLTLEKDKTVQADLAKMDSKALLENELTEIEKRGIDARAKLQQASFNSQVGAAGQIAGNLAQIAKAGGKDQFDNYKAFASAQAAINAAMAISGVLAQSAVLGPLAIPLSVSIGALAAVQIAQIQGQEYQPRALGGQMKAGGSFLVGERGPELITMGNKSANIQAAGSFGGGQTVQVTNVFQISTGVAETVQAEIFRLAPVIARMSAAEYNKQIRQGGTTSRIMGAR